MKWLESPYDDALSMNTSGELPDLEVIWYDVEALLEKPRFELLEWLTERIKALREVSSAPILAVVLGLQGEQEKKLIALARAVPGVRVAPVCQVIASLQAPYDPRLLKISGARLSEEANLVLAKHMACRWLPALLSPRIKAVVIDLDQTVYSGVLGEDGADVLLTPDHASLQAALVKLKESGLFLAVVSKNEPEDVEALFAKRQDFPLRLSDFSAVEIGWESKSESILRVCQKMRIDHSAVLFIDDNPGELIEVARRLPEVELLHAGPEVCRTVRELDYYPGLWSWGVSSEDILRIADLGAETMRKNIQSRSPDQLTYLRSLAPEIDVWVNPLSLAGRLAELSQKTNQFNLALRRLDEVKVHEYIEDKNSFAVGIGLRDRLTDSGIVAAIFGRIKEEEIIVDEWVISCRALGREMETLMASSALSSLASRSGLASFNFRSGPRNNPAREWLAKIAGVALELEGSLQVKLPLLSMVADMPVGITIHEDEKP